MKMLGTELKQIIRSQHEFISEKSYQINLISFLNRLIRL